MAAIYFIWISLNRLNRKRYPNRSKSTRILIFGRIGPQNPVSSEISDLCKISDLILFFSYFSSQSKGIKFGNYFFDVCCVNWNILVRYQVPTTSHSTGITLSIENFRTSWLISIIFVFLSLNQTLTLHTYLNTKLIISFISVLGM